MTGSSDVFIAGGALSQAVGLGFSAFNFATSDFGQSLFNGGQVPTTPPLVSGNATGGTLV
jgi:hypothetical protein